MRSILRSMTPLCLALLCLPQLTHARPPTDPSAGLELAVGLFAPRIGDDEARAYHRDAFGGSTVQYSVGATRYFAGDARLDPAYGAIGLQAMVGRWRFEAQDGAELSATPISLAVVWRHDQLKRRWKLPLIGYLKVGGDCYLWEGKGSYRAPQEGRELKKRGTATGLHGSVGLGFDFDLGRVPARAHYVSTVLLVEVGRSWVNGFATGSTPRRLDLSSTIARVGLAVDL